MRVSPAVVVRRVKERYEDMTNETQHAAAIVVFGALAFLIAVRYFMGAPVVEVVSA